MRLSVQVVIAALIFVVAGAAWFITQRNAAEATAGKERARGAATVNVVTPRLGVVRESVEAVGTTTASDSVFVVAEVSGRVVRLNFDEGQHIAAGTVLVELDERQANADLQVAQSQLQDAQSKYRRAQQLQSSRSISESAVDELRANLDVAQARVVAAQTILANHRIIAPFDGVIGLRNISIGAFLEPGDQITTLDAVDEIELQFSVPERFLDQLTPERKIIARSDAFPGRIFEGQVSQIGTRVDPVSRSVAVKSVIDNRKRTLRPGQFMTVELILEERQDAVLIPEQSVLTEGDRQYAFIIRDNRAERVQVRLGRRLQGEVEVLNGIAAGDRVVVTGLARLRGGQEVQVLDDPAAVLSLNTNAAAVTP